jgi:hypothetical protein
MQQRVFVLTAISGHPPLAAAARRLKRKSSAPQAKSKERAKSSALALGMSGRSNASAVPFWLKSESKE